MTGDRPGDEAAPTQIAALPVAERRVLAALAVVGRASLSADELAELAEVKDIEPLVADLQRRDLIKRDEKRRCALGSLGEEIRQTDDFLSTGDRLLQYMTTLAKSGRLTPGRLLDDAEAILGLTGWAADWQRWEQLLELVKTLQASFEIAHRVDDWLTILDRGRSAAHGLGDRRSEVWMLRQLAAASASAGDSSAARQYLREADELEGRLPGGPDKGGKGRAGQIALGIIGSIVVVIAGGATGYAIGNSNANSGVGTTTITKSGPAVTTFKTVTKPPVTVLSTTTVIETIGSSLTTTTAGPATTISGPATTRTTGPTTTSTPAGEP